jgi:hypothetical protein
MFLLKLVGLLAFPVLSPAQTAGWVRLENALGEIRSLDVGPDGRLYVLEYSGESVDYPNLRFSLPLCDLHISSDEGATLERIAVMIGAVPPIFLPSGEILVVDCQTLEQLDVE